ncbi:hypothetical protein D3C87_1801800 [compost metagenome]
MMAISSTETARISPNRKPIRSMRTVVRNPTSTRPTASVEWLNMPSSASIDSVACRCSTISAPATSAATAKTPSVMLMDSRIDSATPSSAECAMVSPK